MLYCI